MILVCGEALFDVFLAGEDARGRLTLDAAPGGSPFNIAIGLARLGRRAGFFGGLSRDLFGERLAAILAREGVDISCAPRGDAPTTLAFVELQKDRSARYDFRGDGAADRMISPDDLPALSDDVRALTFGSYSTVVRPAGDALLALARRESKTRVVVYDPNIRPTVEPDMMIWSAAFDAFAATAAIVKASADDLALLSGDKDGRSHESIAIPLTAEGKLVVVTSAEHGVAAYGNFGLVRRPSLATSLVDSVGAGDTVTAALIGWLDEQGKLSREAIASLDARDAEAMLDFAMRAAAVTCGRRGADLPRRGDV